MLQWMTPRAGSLDTLELRDVSLPEIRAEELLVRVKAAAVNPADLRVLEGGPGARFIHARRFPLTPGYDFSGVVERVGEGIQGRRVGDEVFGFLPYTPKNDRGTLSEFVVVAPGESHRKPAGLTFAEAAASATCGMTALKMIRVAGKFRPERRVLVNGASGGVGSFVVQIARAYGAEVWGTSSAANMPFVQRLGADRVLDYATTDPRSIESRFQLIADVADRWSFRKTERILRTGGAYVTTMPSLRFARGKIASAMSSKSCVAVSVSHGDLADRFEELARLLGARRIKVPLHASYSMEDAPEAFRLLRDGSVRGKVAVVVSTY